MAYILHVDDEFGYMQKKIAALMDVSQSTISNAVIILYIYFLQGGNFMNKKKKINTIVGSIGAFIGVFVFITYIPQIIANLGGEKAQPLQPLTASISCLIWVIYGWTKEPKKDFILIVPNLAGVILGFLTFITAL